MQSLSSITSILSGHKNQLFRKYGLKQLAIFGSYARNEQQAQSDIDILVDFERPIGIEFIDLAEELEGILHAKVDLVSKNGVKPKYLQSITGELKYV